MFSTSFLNTIDKLKSLDKPTMLIEVNTLIEIRENRILSIKKSTLPIIAGERDNLKAEIKALKELINQ